VSSLAAGGKDRHSKAQARAERQAQQAAKADHRAAARAEYEARRAESRPRAGASRPQAGRVPRRIWLPHHRGTSARLQGLYPFIAESGLGPSGVYVGQDRTSRSSFAFSPWELYQLGVITNPNVLLAGVIGRGKSSLAKTLLFRSAAFGVRSYVPGDPKGEYTKLARTMGCEPVALGRGLSARLNPLDAGARPPVAVGSAAEIGWLTTVRNRRLLLLAALPETLLARRLTPIEYTGLELALDHVTGQLYGTDPARLANPTLNDVLGALRDPDEAAARDAGIDSGVLREGTRDLALTLRRLVKGDLAGLFDGQTSVPIDFDQPITVLNLERIQADDTVLSLIMTCSSAWMESALSDPGGGQRYLVYDEAWRLMRHLGLVRRMQEQFKLSRAWGLSNIVIMHRLSDLRAVGEAGSEAVALAEGLLADCSTRIVYQQEADQVERTRSALGLTDVEAGLLPMLGRGIGLWKIGRRGFVVEHVIGGAEWDLINTDSRMVHPAAAG